MYEDGEGNLILPRNYIPIGDKEFIDNRSIGRETKFLTSITLREYQKTFMDENPCLLDNSDILLEAKCGSGKTIMGIFLSSMIQRQTLVLVPTYYLAKQWRQRITETTDASVIIITSDTAAIPIDTDFTIVVMDLFTLRDFPTEFCKNIGHVILDEAHRVGAETYLPILQVIPAKRRTALTATFRRADGVHKILKYHFGTHFLMKSNFPDPLVYAIKTGVTFESIWKKDDKLELFKDFLSMNDVSVKETNSLLYYETEANLRASLETMLKKNSINKTNCKKIAGCLTKAEKPAYTLIDSLLNEHSGRRKLTIALIKKCLDEGRTVLFLSKRKDILKILHKYFAEYNPALVISETKERSAEEEEYLQKKCRLILGVVQLAKEGLDIDRLDTLIIHLPMRDVEQALGRISRIYAGKKVPKAFYLLDKHPITYSIYRAAQSNFKPYKDCTLKEYILFDKK